MALQRKKMWDDTLMVLASDNGGHKGGVNYPLRGMKGTNWEGGIRTAAFVSGGFVPEGRRGTTNPIVFSITDWYPTFCSLAGVDPTDNPKPGSPYANDKWPAVDGVDIWPMLTKPNHYQVDSAHESLVVTGQVVIAGKYKLVHSQTAAGLCNAPQCYMHQAVSGDWQQMEQPNCHGLPGDRWEDKVPCVFDLASDPREMRDLAPDHPELTQRLLRQLEGALQTSFTPASPPELVGPCNDLCALNHFVRASDAEAMVSMRLEHLEHARDAETWESSDALYALSQSEMRAMGFELPEGLPQSWTRAEMARASELELRYTAPRSGSANASNLGAFAMRPGDVDLMNSHSAMEEEHALARFTRTSEASDGAGWVAQHPMRAAARGHPPKDAAWAAAHPNRADEAAEWARLHPKRASGETVPTAPPPATSPEPTELWPRFVATGDFPTCGVPGCT